MMMMMSKKNEVYKELKEMLMMPGRDFWDQMNQ